MSLDQRNIRRGMDVFTLDGAYVGTVMWIRQESLARNSPASSVARVQRPSAPSFSGESLGPMPTAELGNDGPSTQSPERAYASHLLSGSDSAASHPTELIVFRWLVWLDPSTLRPRLRRIPVSLVQATSLERIILSVTAHDLDRT